MICLDLRDDADWDAVRQRVGDCMGVAKFYLASKVPPDLDAVKELLLSELPLHRFDTFRITAHRSNKRFPMRSGDINREMGTYVEELTGAGVRLKGADLEIFIDVVSDGMLVYFDPIQGYGGMPVDSSGDDDGADVGRHRLAGCGVADDAAWQPGQAGAFSQPPSRR